MRSDAPPPPPSSASPPSESSASACSLKSAYGSGQFKKDLDTALGGEESLVTSAVDDREGIPVAIRSFLGRGR